MFLSAAIAAVDAITAVTLFGVICVGAGFLALPALYLIEWTRGKVGAELDDARYFSEGEFPEVLVQVPVYNEPSELIDDLSQSLANLDWPRERLHIQMLEDLSGTGEEIAGVSVAKLRDAGIRADHLVRRHRLGYKAGALAAGLGSSSAPLVAILDADFRPPADWLKRSVPRLAAHPAAGFIQSRCEFSNAETNWLTRAQSLLFDSHFVMEQGVRARAGMLFQFNGTGAVWRRRAIEDAGGWTGDSLCEDLDLTIRAALAGWKGLFQMHPAVKGLVPDRIRHWRVQQRRWATGFAQIARKLGGRLWRSPWSVAEKLQAGFLILYQGALPVIALASVALLLDLALRGGALSPAVMFLLATILILFLPVVVGMTLPPYLELKRGGVGRYLSAFCALPPLILYLSLANARPIVAAFLGRGEVFKRTPKPVPES
jgi:cellulose synthase/poly-beta-1,6-N-acetylglucosamine synthase-like glycosyltransferase